MSEEFEQALLQVAKSMDGLARVFEHRVAELQALGEADELIREAAGALQAVKDSGAIYLTWANHYAKRASGGDAAEHDDFAEDEFEA